MRLRVDLSITWIEINLINDPRILYQYIVFRIIIDLARTRGYINLRIALIDFLKNHFNKEYIFNDNQDRKKTKKLKK